MHKLVCSSAQPVDMNKKLQRPSRFEIKTNRTSKNKNKISITKIKIQWANF